MLLPLPLSLPLLSLSLPLLLISPGLCSHHENYLSNGTDYPSAQPQMLAVRMHEWGEPDVLKLETCDVPPPPNDDQVLIMVKAAPIYPWDVKIRKNQYARPVEKLPAILGQEVSGYVIMKGQNVRNVNVGDRVFAKLPRWEGGYAQLALANYNDTYHLPKHFSFEQASAYRLLTEASAYRLLTKASAFNRLAETSAYRLLTEASAYRLLTEASAYRLLTKASAFNRLAETSAYHLLTEASAYRLLTAAYHLLAEVSTAYLVLLLRVTERFEMHLQYYPQPMDVDEQYPQDMEVDPQFPLPMEVDEHPTGDEMMEVDPPHVPRIIWGIQVVPMFIQ
ncbi:hypothetical protein M8J76_011118 [Diaphorina citri]|nr:hypothetical protein M8J76_011118 [Diaphorina citri]